MTIKAEHDTAAYWENSKPRDERLGPPPPPGAILLHDFLEPLGISINQMSKDLGIPYKHAHDLITGKRAITAMTALLLAKYLRTAPQFWLGLQSNFELEQLRGQVRERMASVREFPRPDLDETQSDDACGAWVAGAGAVGASTGQASISVGHGAMIVVDSDPIVLDVKLTPRKKATSKK